ncbi:MAG: hypothetical protein KKD28_13575, partial [Chloroflexi bacterium]|nr:hypothetical protein [Chloroflexota bacterium]
MSSKVDKKIWLIFTIILTACNVIAVQTVEVIEIVTTKEILTQLTTASETATPEPKNYSEQEQQFITIEALNQGAIMLVQYYTLLDYGLYEEAYQLLSSSKQQRSLDDYIEMMEMAFVNVEIISVQP